MTVTAVRQADRRKLEGIHYTPTALSMYVARRLVEISDLPTGRPVRILDPACGDGELLLALCHELTGLGYAVDVIANDIDPEAVSMTVQRLQETGLPASVTGTTKDFLEDLAAAEHGTEPTLFELPTSKPEEFDLIIANPPYVRTQHLGSDRARTLAKKFGLRGRVDLYQAFLAGFRSALRDGGSFGLIVPNRFLMTRGGESTRELLARLYEVQQIVDLGDTKLFDAAVLPALVFGTVRELETQQIPITSIYSAGPDADESSAQAESVFEALDSHEGSVQVEASSWEVNRGQVIVDSWGDFKAPWVSRSSEAAFLASVDEAASMRFSDIGKIRVGVKTTADKVFIRSNWDDLDEATRPEHELLYPLVSSDTATRWSCRHASISILYPYDMTSRKRVALDLADFPRTSAYLAEHRERLEGRSYVIKAGRQWWEIWVPQKPADWMKLKVVFPDISVEGKFAIDRTGALVNGNCYWIALDEGQEDMGYLAVAVANSSLAMRYYDGRFGNKLYAGRRRFMSQYVENFPLPDPNHPSSVRAVELAKQMEREPELALKLEPEADAAIWSAFGLEQP